MKVHVVLRQPEHPPMELRRGGLALNSHMIEEQSAITVNVFPHVQAM